MKQISDGMSPLFNIESLEAGSLATAFYTGTPFCLILLLHFSFSFIKHFAKKLKRNTGLKLEKNKNKKCMCDVPYLHFFCISSVLTHLFAHTVTISFTQGFKFSFSHYE